MSTTVSGVNLENSTAVAPASGDSSSALPTTAWVRALLSGYSPGGGSVTLPGGLIIKWGSAGGGNPQSVSFGTPFPTALFSVVLTSLDFGVGATRNVAYITSQNTGGFSAQTDSSSVAFNWIAIGN